MNSIMIHHGYNIKQVRRVKSLSRNKIAGKLGMPVQTVSFYESMSRIEESILEQFANALNVPVEYLESMETELPMIIIENNTFKNNQNISNVGNYHVEDSSTNTFNPIDKIVELYERLLTACSLNTAALEKRIEALESKYGHKRTDIPGNDNQGVE